MEQTTTPKSGIKKVQFYVAAPVQSCDRCSAAIKHVAVVTYADGLVERYGSECINKVLANAPSLQGLFAKNSKLLKKYTHWLEVLNREPKDMPRGSEYYNAGLYFIADDNGKDIYVDEHWFFHPQFDVEKNAAGTSHVIRDTPEQYAAKNMAEINGRRGKQWLANEVIRLETFLAKILQKGGLTAA
jgi:hypothetical protein